jgi:hypothetical protein
VVGFTGLVARAAVAQAHPRVRLATIARLGIAVSEAVRAGQDAHVALTRRQSRRIFFWLETVRVHDAAAPRLARITASATIEVGFIAVHHPIVTGCGRAAAALTNLAHAVCPVDTDLVGAARGTAVPTAVDIGLRGSLHGVGARGHLTLASRAALVDAIAVNAAHTPQSARAAVLSSAVDVGFVDIGRSVGAMAGRSSVAVSSLSDDVVTITIALFEGEFGSEAGRHDEHRD